MPAGKLLEDFGSASESEPAVDEAASEFLEDAKLKAFEDGYGAGWDDALRAQSENARVISEALQLSVKEATLLRETVLAEYLAACRELFEAVLSQVLPKVGSEAFPAHLVEILSDAVRTQTDLPLILSVSAEEAKALKNVVDAQFEGQVRVAVDETLVAGQAVLKLGPSEEQIDLSRVIAGIDTAVRELLQTGTKEAQNE